MIEGQVVSSAKVDNWCRCFCFNCSTFLRPETSRARWEVMGGRLIGQDSPRQGPRLARKASGDGEPDWILLALRFVFKLFLPRPVDPDPLDPDDGTGSLDRTLTRSLAHKITVPHLHHHHYSGRKISSHSIIKEFVRSFH